MALPRKKIPRDPDSVVRARELRKPQDWSKVIPKNPDDAKRWHYQFVMNQARALGMAKGIGFQYATSEEVDCPSIMADEATGHLIYNDVVLMKMPMAIRAERAADLQAMSDVLIRREYENEAEELIASGVRVKHTLRRGRATKISANPADYDEEIVNVET